MLLRLARQTTALAVGNIGCRARVAGSSLQYLVCSSSPTCVFGHQHKIVLDSRIPNSRRYLSQGATKESRDNLFEKGPIGFEPASSNDDVNDNASDLLPIERGGRLSDEIEASLAMKRSIVYGSIWGAATAMALAIPPVAQPMALFTEPTAMALGATLICFNSLAAGCIHHRIIQPKSDNLGKIGTLEGCVSGGAVALSAHLFVPLLVLGLPSIVNYGNAHWAVEQWLTEFPIDVANYGIVLAWWGLADFGMKTIPSAAVLGMAFSFVSTKAIHVLGLDIGQWSAGMDLRSPEVIEEEERKRARAALDKEAQMVASLSTDQYRGKV